MERAIETVERALEAYKAPIYVKHQIVHNSHVVNSLAEKGAVFVESLEEVPEGSTVVFSAHGSPPKAYEEAATRKLRVIDATCPLVSKVHLEARRYSKEGYGILLVGHMGHVEVIGTSGEAPEETQLIETVEDAMKVSVPNPEKIVCLTQTTLSIDDTKKIIDTLKVRFPKLILPPKGDICYATQNRQNAVKQLIQDIQLLLVVGSRESSNANRLVEVAKAAGVPAHLINDYKEISQDWLKNADSVGLTSGASTPEYLVKEAIEHLKKSGNKNITEKGTIAENMKFAMPKI